MTDIDVTAVRGAAIRLGSAGERLEGRIPAEPGFAEAGRDHAEVGAAIRERLGFRLARLRTLAVAARDHDVRLRRDAGAHAAADRPRPEGVPR